MVSFFGVGTKANQRPEASANPGVVPKPAPAGRPNVVDQHASKHPTSALQRLKSTPLVQKFMQSSFGTSSAKQVKNGDVPINVETCIEKAEIFAKGSLHMMKLSEAKMTEADNFLSKVRPKELPNTDEALSFKNGQCSFLDAAIRTFKRRSKNTQFVNIAKLKIEDAISDTRDMIAFNQEALKQYNLALGCYKPAAHSAGTASTGRRPDDSAAPIVGDSAIIGRSRIPRSATSKINDQIGKLTALIVEQEQDLVDLRAMKKHLGDTKTVVRDLKQLALLDDIHGADSEFYSATSHSSETVPGSRFASAVSQRIVSQTAQPDSLPNIPKTPRRVADAPKQRGISEKGINYAHLKV